jgi:hypothetical protein
MMLMRAIADEATAAAVRVGPPGAVATVAFLNLSLQDWVYVVTLVLLLAQIAYLFWKWRRERRKA